MTTGPTINRGIVEIDGHVLIHGDCMDELPSIECDAIITDPPFSERTHSGHNASANGHAGFGNDGSERVALHYEHWTERDVAGFMNAQRANGWVVALTDHVLAPFWCAEMECCGRYTFAPLAAFQPGRSVRLSGDGPSSWTTWIVVSRTKDQSRWGTLPGGYLVARGEREYIGGKPIGLMNSLVRDYSRQGDVVCDPCMGSGTTGIACIQLGRRFIGIEKDEATFNIAVERMHHEQKPLF